mgnify:FL=1
MKSKKVIESKIEELVKNFYYMDKNVEKLDDSINLNDMRFFEGNLKDLLWVTSKDTKIKNRTKLPSEK